MEREGARFSPVLCKSKHYCSVYSCRSLAKRDITVRFHKFPKPGELITIRNQKVDRRKEWIRVLRMGEKTTATMHVCSLHFKREDYIHPDAPAKRRHLKKIAVPNCNLPKSSAENATVSRKKAKDVARAERILNRAQLNADAELIVKEEAQIQIKSEAPQLECDITYDDSIKLELLHEEIDLKIEILNNHEEQTINEAVGNKLFEGSVCSCTCADRSSFRRHLEIHTGEKPFKCSVCSYACIQNGSLKRHMKSHSGAKSYKCSVCTYASAAKRSLEYHMNTHTGEKPFKCDVCSYACSYNSGLRKHMRSHTGEKPFRCGECGYAFAHKCNVKRHMKVHTGEKTLQV